jgi:hypothetical protein
MFGDFAKAFGDLTGAWYLTAEMTAHVVLSSSSRELLPLVIASIGCAS